MLAERRVKGRPRMETPDFPEGLNVTVYNANGPALDEAGGGKH